MLSLDPVRVGAAAGLPWKSASPMGNLLHAQSTGLHLNQAGLVQAGQSHQAEVMLEVPAARCHQKLGLDPGDMVGAVVA